MHTNVNGNSHNNANEATGNLHNNVNGRVNHANSSNKKANVGQQVRYQLYRLFLG